mgnify:CR=1 FL=1
MSLPSFLFYAKEITEMADFKKSVSLMNNASDVEINDTEYTEEEAKSVIKANEEDFIQGLIDAVGFRDTETQRIEIVRGGKLLFAFRIHPLNADDYNRCREKHTKYVRNKQLGMRFPENTDSTKYRSEIIYQATVKEDREKLWDNKTIWEALRDREVQIMGPLDVIEYSLLAGEKDRVLEAIDNLSGFDTNLEEVTKN